MLGSEGRSARFFDCLNEDGGRAKWPWLLKAIRSFSRIRLRVFYEQMRLRLACLGLEIGLSSFCTFGGSFGISDYKLLLESKMVPWLSVLMTLSSSTLRSFTSLWLDGSPPSLIGSDSVAAASGLVPCPARRAAATASAISACTWLALTEFLKSSSLFLSLVCCRSSILCLALALSFCV